MHLCQSIFMLTTVHIVYNCQINLGEDIDGGDGFQYIGRQEMDPTSGPVYNKWLVKICIYIRRKINQHMQPQGVMGSADRCWWRLNKPQVFVASNGSKSVPYRQPTSSPSERQAPTNVVSGVILQFSLIHVGLWNEIKLMCRQTKSSENDMSSGMLSLEEDRTAFKSQPYHSLSYVNLTSSLKSLNCSCLICEVEIRSVLPGLLYVL